MNEFVTRINARRSIRAYTGESVSDAQLKTIIDCGMHAPSAHNRQPWVFLTITEKDKLREISPLCKWWGMLPSAGAVIITCMNTPLTEGFAEEFSIASCCAATENMLLAAGALGLGAVWLGVCRESEFYEDFCRVIALPEELRVISMIAVGVPAEQKEAAERFAPGKWFREHF